MDAHTRSTTRRRLAATGIAGAAVLALGRRADALPSLQDDGTPIDLNPVTGKMPKWTVLVYSLEDPYPGKLTAPATPDPDKRYAAIDVEVRNDSDLPLALSAGQFRLHGEDNVDYLTGGVVGEDPRLIDVNMLPGDRARGRVYFALPRDVAIANIVFQPPVFQIHLDAPKP